MCMQIIVFVTNIELKILTSRTNNEIWSDTKIMAWTFTLETWSLRPKQVVVTLYMLILVLRNFVLIVNLHFNL